jgi:hypothetical protein
MVKKVSTQWVKGIDESLRILKPEQRKLNQNYRQHQTPLIH